MGFGEIIREAREAAHLSQEALGKTIGVSGVTVGNWERGATRPRGANAQRLIEALDIDPLELLSSDPGIAMTTGLNSSSAERRRAFTANAKVPLYGRIAAGMPIEMLPVEDEQWVRPDVLADHPNGFYLRVTGESMNRVLPDGSLAFVDPEAEVGNGDVAALTVGGQDATVKRYYRGSSSVTLSPDSADASFKDVILDYSVPGTDEVSLIGKVVWFTAPYGGRL